MAEELDEVAAAGTGEDGAGALLVSLLEDESLVVVDDAGVDGVVDDEDDEPRLSFL